MSVFATLVEQLADLLRPLFGLSAAAAAIIAFTALVRLLVHPLSRAAARGQKARAALQPRIAELRRKHGKNPEKLQKAVLELHAEEKVSPLSGCLPSLLQLPAFFLLYHLFSSGTIGGESNTLLTHQLLDAPLGGRWADALGDGGVFGGAGLVYLGLFAVVTVVAYFSYRLSRRMTEASAATAGAGADPQVPCADPQVPGAAAMGGVMKVMPFMSFFTLVTVAVVPLAAALYVVTSTTWSVIERSVLYR
ncbi:YidC/Oxa1 family membrane protein insertase [Streptomyces albogriseolus]|uniref:YidC/Oxa1 family membrane protein insertase n=1 Tax=Streptomyces albogriseolus TaxID=1887 RepID=UPI0036F87153